jgi:CBS domain containing-hemolysin-like protein
VLLSVSDSFVSLIAEEGKSHAPALRAMKDDIDKPLATILSLNTVAHTVGAAGVGAQAQVVFGEASLTIVSAVLTLLILLLSEIIPKTLGARYWRNLTFPAVKLLQVLNIVMYPLVWLSLKITRSMGDSGHSISFSREEFAAMASRGVEEGVLAPDEAMTFKNMIFFETLTGHDVMTPRTVVFSLSSNSTIAEVLSDVSRKNFSRLPIYGEHKEDIQGYVLKTDILQAAIDGQQDALVADYRRDILTVTENLSLKELFQRMMDRHEHICVLIDEYAGFSGICTMEDIVETLLGQEIMDEVDTTRDMQILARRYWQQRAVRNGIQVVPEEDKPA